MLEAAKDSDITEDSELSLGISLLRMSLDVEYERVVTIELSIELDDEEPISKVRMPLRGKMGDNGVVKDGVFNVVVLVDTS